MEQGKSRMLRSCHVFKGKEKDFSFISLFSFIDPLQSVLIRFVSLLSNLETQFGPNSKKYSTSDMNVVWSPFCFLLLLLLCHFCFNDIPFIRSHKCVFVTMLNSLLESKVVE